MKTNLIIASLVGLLLVNSLTSCFCFATSPTSNLTDQSALLAFKSQLTLNTNDPSMLNWTPNVSVCNWIGVSCSPRHQRVMSLNLSFMNIQGTVSPYIGNLSFLTVLNLRNNSFRGQLPETLGRLRRLRVINLRFNQLGGVIPSNLSQCQRLQQIIFGSNQLQGTIPETIGNLRDLEVLQLYENSLTGIIPLTIFNISTLRVIDIMVNNISGGIPATICHKLQRLELLYLSFNPLGGPFPTTLCQCVSLREIQTVQNYFTGSIPNDIGCLSNLEYLNLARNLLTSTIPPSIGNLSRLWYLEFIDNNLSGGLPPELAKLSRIKYLRIAFNKQISGRIPQGIFNLSSVELISFMNNGLSGDVSDTTGLLLPNLRSLNLLGNRLTGNIPNFISNASKLIFLELSNNLFSGSVPVSLGNLRFLETLNLQRNQLTGLDFLTTLTECRQLKNLVTGKNPLNGFLPNSIGNLSTSLELFNADVAQIKGSIPISIGNLSNLISLELAGNDLTGTIPFSFQNLKRLQRLRLFENNLEGSIPNELCRSTFLWELLLNDNKISGSIPSCIGSITRLQVIDLSSNLLTSIPLELWSLTGIWYLNISHNSLNGNLPPEIGNLIGLDIFNLSKNQLSGNIPSTVSNLKMLRLLNFSDNGFQGSIPESIGDMTSLESLDLSFNSLSGMIPKSLEKLPNLNQLNLSFNKLSGEVPLGGRLGKFTAQSFLGNYELCGIKKFDLRACKTRSHQLWLKYIIPPITSTIAIFALLLIITRRQVKRRKTKTPSSIELSLAMAPQLISYYELLRATENFAEANLLGMGSFGSVYKGTMSNGTIVAVKVLDLQVDGALASFDAECEVLRNVRHRNLVKIISCCSNLDFRALILEYMPNGSFEKLLYSQNICLDLLQRLDVMIDVAVAVEYLHYGYSEPVVHCDLKPSNVLLDDDMVAHVADFGIAKVLAKYKSMTQTATLGTMGYIAPEFGSEGRVSPKGDVYSYGIMVMETFTGKKPTDEMFGGGSSLRHWVSGYSPDSLMEVADLNLLKIEKRATEETLKHTLSAVLELALLCTKDLPDERLTMNGVVGRLRKIEKQFLDAFD